MLATFIQAKPLMRVMFFKVHLFIVMFLQGDLFVEEMFVRVNQLVIQIFVIEILLTRGMLFQVNLLILTISISLIYHWQTSRYFTIIVSFLTFLVYCKCSIFKMSIFRDDKTVDQIYLFKETFHIVYFMQQHFLGSDFNTYIIFAWFRTILPLNTPKVSFFTNY